MGTNTLAEKIKEYNEYKKMGEEMLAVASSIADELKNLMNEIGQEKLVIGEYKLSYTAVSRKDIDKKALANDYSEIYNAYLTGIPFHHDVSN